MMIAMNSWTGTRGVSSPDLTGEWSEVRKTLEERVQNHHVRPINPFNYPAVVERAAAFVIREFGEDELEGLTVKDMVELYLDG